MSYNLVEVMEVKDICRQAIIRFRQKSNNIAADKMTRILNAIEALQLEIVRLEDLTNENDIPF